MLSIAFLFCGAGEGSGRIDFEGGVKWKSTYLSLLTFAESLVLLSACLQSVG